MTYELAKKLKDAGFPQKEISVIVGNEGHFIPDPLHLNKYLYAPSLEELIEACGKDFYSVNQYVTSDGKGWSAESWKSGDIQTGFTPSEALANLWLALQTK